MSVRKLARLKKKAGGMAKILGMKVGNLKTRFQLRRVIMEADLDGIRSDEELAMIHHWLVKETSVGKVPFWVCLAADQQQRLCKLLNMVQVPHPEPGDESPTAREPRSLKFDARQPNSYLYIIMSGEVRIEAIDLGGNRFTKRLGDGDVFGDLHLQDKMRETLQMKLQNTLRAEWIENRRKKRAERRRARTPEGETEEERQRAAEQALAKEMTYLESRCPDFLEEAKVFDPSRKADLPPQFTAFVKPGTDYLTLSSIDVMPELDVICDRISKLAVLNTLGLRCMISCATHKEAPAGKVLAKQGVKATEVLVLVEVRSSPLLPPPSSLLAPPGSLLSSAIVPRSPEASPLAPGHTRMSPASLF